MMNPIFYNEKALKVLKAYSEKKLKYALAGVRKEPYEIMQEVENETRLDTLK
jgi:hypothetical protein